jgi:DNA-binding LytR/AlgR family response regulator
MINILIVEDDPIIGKDIAYAIEDLGYAVVAVCRNHQTALSSLQKQIPDLVLCDIILEGDDWDGIQLATEIRRLYDLPLIFLTALTDSNTIARAAVANPDAYLTKPFDRRTLYAAIELAVLKFAKQQQPATEQPDNAAEIGEFLPFIAGNFFVKDKKRLVKVSAEDILFIKAEGVYSHLTTATRTFLLTTHLGALEDKLKGRAFLRVHRSYLINFNYIEAIEDDTLSIGTERIPLGKSYREAFYQRLQQL